MQAKAIELAGRRHRRTHNCSRRTALWQPHLTPPSSGLPCSHPCSRRCTPQAPE